MKGADGTPSTVTAQTRSVVFNSVRKVLREAMDTGRAEHLGLDRQFITSMPPAGGAPLRARRPFPDEVARALADEDNLARLAGTYDPEDQGLRDIWETIVTTGRRTGEVLNLRWDCIGRYGNLPMFWHDQTKVGNYDASIRIPERLYDLLAARSSARPRRASGQVRLAAAGRSGGAAHGLVRRASARAPARSPARWIRLRRRRLPGLIGRLGLIRLLSQRRRRTSRRPR